MSEAIHAYCPKCQGIEPAEILKQRTKTKKLRYKGQEILEKWTELYIKCKICGYRWWAFE